MKVNLIVVLLILVILRCSESKQCTLEFRIAEDKPSPGLTEVIHSPTGKRFYLHPEVLLTQDDVDYAEVISQEDRPAVKLILTDEGTEKFRQLTEANVGKRCAMILNGQIVSAPRIMSSIHSGIAILVGDFTEAEAGRVAREFSSPDNVQGSR